MNKSDSKKKSPEFGEEFYRGLGIDDEKLFSNIELGIELYQGKHDRKSRPSEVSVNFERALGIFSTSYVRLVQGIIKQRKSLTGAQYRLLMDFGAIDPRTMRNPEVIKTLKAESISRAKSGRYEIFYLSEWLTRISRAAIKPTSEAAQSSKKTDVQEEESRLKDKLEKLEKELDKYCKEELDKYTELKGSFKLFSLDGNQGEKVGILKQIRRKVSALETVVKEQNIRFADIDVIKARRKGGAGNDASGEVITGQGDKKYERMREEFDTLISVIRSCSVRGGLVKNTPSLIDKWVPMDTRLKINTRASISETLDQFEQLDYTIFHNKRAERHAPRILIVPGVGSGMSWSDRIILSLFPPPTMKYDVSIARTFAGFRWYKATSSFNWKHLPGELGSMYQLIYPDKTFNKLEKSFIDDYTTWMTKESLGYQTLKADVRNLFWRMIPFPEEHKRKLSKRATAYGKLYAEDIARR